MKREMLVAALVWAAGAVPCMASHEDIGTGAVAAGMGEAMTAGAEGIAAMEYNPAGLGGLRTAEFGMGFKRAFRIGAGKTDLSQMSWSFGGPVHWSLVRGALGMSWAYAPRTDVALDRTLGLTYATKGFKEFDAGMLDFGLTLKSMSRSGSTAGGSVAKLGVDLGATLRMHNNRTLGMSFLNLNGPRMDAGGVPDRAPVIFKAGYAEVVRGFAVAVDFTKREPSLGFPASQSVASGLEYWWHTARTGAFAARTGLNLGDPSRFWGLGGGWRILGAELDYAIQIPLASGSRWGNCVSLLYRFGGWSPEKEYEKMLGSELRYRQELSKSLDTAEVKQWKLSEELQQLREDMNTLRAELATKTADEARAKERLRVFEERERKAREAMEELERQRRAAAARSKDSLFREDWQKYQKLKSDGAPDLMLQERVKQLLRQYKDLGVDLSEANQELLRLQRNAP